MKRRAAAAAVVVLGWAVVTLACFGAVLQAMAALDGTESDDVGGGGPE